MLLCVAVSVEFAVLYVKLLFFQFLKRQDLLNVLARMMRPICDQVVRTSQAK